MMLDNVWIYAILTRAGVKWSAGLKDIAATIDHLNEADKRNTYLKKLLLLNLALLKA